MNSMFDSLYDLLRAPLNPVGGIKTDNSIFLIYPPEKELDFKEDLLDGFFPLLTSKGVSFRQFDLADFLFTAMDEKSLENLQEDEFDEYHWMKQGLSKRIEQALQNRLAEISGENPGAAIFVYSTMAIYPLVRFGEVQQGFRELNCRIIFAFPGEERGGKLHFMNQPNGGNYLAVKLFWQ